MDYEKLGAFYLGKECDIQSNRLSNRLLMYDARDLTTHAVCIGMTGSGKTGLCIDILEEAALDRVPAIIIDPKGDITNLLLQFPDLLPQDFLPWINSDDARRKGMSLEDYAKSQAELWKNGIAEWGQEQSRISSLKKSAEFKIYTPGSEAGDPVSVLQSFHAPGAWESQVEESREEIQSSVSGLLSLLGKDADPIRSKEHILLSNILEFYWKQDESLDFQKLILSIQNPPIRRLGVFDIDTFIPESARFELAMQLNSLLASPSFSSWMKGKPLDVSGFLGNQSGKPRHSIFYLAHLEESERTFFVTMLLNRVISWMRAQPGTTSLRAILYMDEIFGFLPPVSNPPSKKPLMTLLKQARAYGVGVLLATQNPVDLDYKALTNTGTWFIGRLQTERDKERVLEGMASSSSQTGMMLDRKKTSDLISSLGKRVFLLHNIHDEAPVLFQTRWALSYLRGPLTREQISSLKSAEQAELDPSRNRPFTASDPPPAPSPSITGAGTTLSTPPVLHPGIDQVFLTVSKSAEMAAAETDETSQVKMEKSCLVYKPGIFANGTVHFIDRKRAVDHQEQFTYLTSFPSSIRGVEWDREEKIQNFKITSNVYSEAEYEPLPDGVDSHQSLSNVKKDLSDYLYRSSALKILFCSALNEYSQVNESEREFRLRLSHKAREARDQEVDQLNDTYNKRLQRLRDRLERAEIALDKKQAVSKARNQEFLVSVGESLIGMFLGRRSMRSASSALGKYRMKSTAKMSIEDAEEKVEDLQGEVEELQAELQKKVDSIALEWEQVLSEFEEVAITPRRTDVEIDVVAVGWKPFWRITGQDGFGLQVEKDLPAL